MPRQRGAQPGNLNALKHGFYSRRFKKAELTDLDDLTATGIESEIAMLRILLRRAFDLAGDITSITDSLTTLTALSDGATRLAGLLKTQAFLLNKSPAETSIDDLLKQALEEIAEDYEKTQLTSNRPVNPPINPPDSDSDPETNHDRS